MPIYPNYIKWTQTFKKGAARYAGANVSVYLAGSTTSAILFDANGNQRDTAPQLVTDSAGSITLYLNPDDYHDSALFDIVVESSSCSDDDTIYLNSLMLLQDEEGGRTFHKNFFQDSPPTKEGNNLRDGDRWTDSNFFNHAYRWSSDIEEWVSIQDGSIQLIGYSHGIFAETWEGEARLNYWTNVAGGATPVVTQVSDSVAGGYVLRVGDNSGNDQAWMVFNSNIPFDPTRLYRIKLRARRTAGAGTIYCGFVGIGADGTTLVNINGAEDYGLQHYHCASGVSPGDTSWQDYEGYTWGSASPGTATAGTVPSGGTDNSGKMHEDVRYIRPMILVNYSSAAGITDIDSIIIEALPPSSELVSSGWYIDYAADITGENTSNSTNNLGDTTGDLGVDYNTAENVVGWSDTSDPTLIDGGVITNYIMSTNFDGDTGDGSGGTEGTYFDLSNGKLYVYEADGFQVLGTGALTVMSGTNPNLRVYNSTSGLTTFLWAGGGNIGSIGVYGGTDWGSLKFGTGSTTWGSYVDRLELATLSLHPLVASMTNGTASNPWSRAYIGSATYPWDFRIDGSGNLQLYLSGTLLFVFGTDGKFWSKDPQSVRRGDDTGAILAGVYDF